MTINVLSPLSDISCGAISSLGINASSLTTASGNISTTSGEIFTVTGQVEGFVVRSTGLMHCGTNLQVDGTMECDGDASFFGNIAGSKAGGVTWTGKLSSGIGAPLTIAGINSSGTTTSSIVFNAAGGIAIPNPLAVANNVIVTGHTRALGFGQASEANIGTVTSTATVDWSGSGASQKFTLTNGTACTVSFTAPPNVGWYTLKVVYPASGTVPAITWPATVKWEQATQPTGTKTLGRSTIYRFYYDGSNYWGDAILNAA